MAVIWIFIFFILFLEGEKQAKEGKKTARLL